jgi:hypothetical protein
MFIYTQGTKEKVVTIGVLIACCLLAALAIRCLVIGKYALIGSLVCILVLIALWKGNKVGYFVARFIFGGLAVIFVGGSINPFTYEDVELAHDSYTQFLVISLLFAVLAGFLAYCLGQHAKLRGLKLL